MRDRRNTNLSVSSTDSTPSHVSRSSRNSLQGKGYLDQTPPSPILPAPVTKENRPRPTWRRGMAIRLVAGLFGLLLLWRYMLGCWILTADSRGVKIEPPWPHAPAADGRIDDKTYLVGGNQLPDEPIALMVSDEDGTSKWTVSIPRNMSFPLPSHDYKNICEHGAKFRSTLKPTSTAARGRHWWGEHKDHAVDSTFMDIDRAEDTGALPSRLEDDWLRGTCETSLTFVLQSDEASLGKSLLLLWLSYGLAKKEGRAFFIDDTRWAWGKYLSYFRPPPPPKCTRPPTHQVVPCPRSAKHLVVSAATASWTFGSAFQREFQGAHNHGLAAQSRVHELLRTGYEDLFHLIGEDAEYAKNRIADVKSAAAQNHSPLVGMQIRRGDQHPFEYQYSRDYLPLQRYAEGAVSLVRAKLGLTGKFDDSSIMAKLVSPLLLASDDPDILESPELRQAAEPLSIQRAQERIQLATKTTLDQSLPVKPLRQSGSAYTKHVDENSGWEGGFYSALFFSLGGAKKRSGPSTDPSRVPDQAMRLRELVGRSYLMDLAVLAESDGVVCAISSAGCRMLGVMMGWDAVKSGRWLNVDDGRSWSWNGLR
ncbi:Hypothetical predicted protein [Lecanosticta acicola]|uniref:Uncharacterized protein n=1 Tax=Lecanosticta acicola TaxID=111012 RepID=A0AAI8Z9Q0_9PEZI|nr:Hypothetical predicted protein [Lecanosticta acicola]